MEQSRDDISKRLARRLKEARKSKNLSLEALSSLASVSKSMLSQIERGESSPTVATLLNLTTALNVDFAGLLDGNPKDRGPIKEIIRAEQTPVIMSHGKSCQIRALSAPETVGDIEIYDLQFAAGGTLESQAHSNGCVENLTVFNGELTITTGDSSETVRAGDTIRYMADRPHAIVAGTQPSRCVLIVKGS